MAASGCHRESGQGLGRESDHMLGQGYSVCAGRCSSPLTGAESTPSERSTEVLLVKETPLHDVDEDRWGTEARL